jgi:hypothetical protein
LLRRLCQFAIDEGIIKADSGGVSRSVGVVEMLWTRPVHESHAHGAWLTARVDVAATQLKSIQIATRRPDGNHFGVCAGIIRAKHLVSAFAHNFAVSYNHRAEWAALSGLNIFEGELNSSPHELWIQSFT